LLKQPDWDLVNNKLGTIQVFRPATPWQHQAVDSLAQMLIQAAERVTLKHIAEKAVAHLIELQTA